VILVRRMEIDITNRPHMKVSDHFMQVGEHSGPSPDPPILMPPLVDFMKRFTRYTFAIILENLQRRLDWSGGDWVQPTPG
jgi:hypothetical protein